MPSHVHAYICVTVSHFEQAKYTWQRWRCEVNCTFSVRARPQGGWVGRIFRPMLLAPRCAGRVGRSGRPESVARALSGASGSVGRDGPSQCAAAPWASRSVGTDMFAWCTKIYFSTHTPQPHISTAPLVQISVLPRLALILGHDRGTRITSPKGK